MFQPSAIVPTFSPLTYSGLQVRHCDSFFSKPGIFRVTNSIIDSNQSLISPCYCSSAFFVSFLLSLSRDNEQRVIDSNEIAIIYRELYRRKWKKVECRLNEEKRIIILIILQREGIFSSGKKDTHSDLGKRPWRCPCAGASLHALWPAESPCQPASSLLPCL